MLLKIFNTALQHEFYVLNATPLECYKLVCE